MNGVIPEIFVDENAYGDPRAWSHYPGEDPHELGLNDTVRELRRALSRLGEVVAACERYGACQNGYDPGESCGCLLCEVRAALNGAQPRPAEGWTEQQIREAYDHGSTAGVCEDVDDIISALHYRYHGWSEPCCSSADDAPALQRSGTARPAPSVFIDGKPVPPTPADPRGALAWEDGVLRYDDGSEPTPAEGSET